jgi:hypothetical protein
MSPSDLPRIRISDPAELIDLLPYLIGFHPRESLVLVGFGSATDSDGPGQVQVCVRVDLPSVPAPAAEIETVVDALVRSSVSAAAAVLITADPGPDPRTAERWLRLSGELAELLAAADIWVADVLIASEHRWWSLLCDEPECCPAEGMAREPGVSVTAAQATVAGMVARADRAEVEAQLTPLEDEERARMEPELADAEHRMTRALLDNGLRRLRRTDAAAVFAEITARSAESAKPRRLTDRRLARFGVALTDIEIRDEVWLALDDRELEADSLLHEMLTRLPEPYDAAPLFLFGWTQWRRGNGTLAGMAAERALASDPRYSAANLLLTAVRHGLDPRSTPALREPISA